MARERRYLWTWAALASCAALGACLGAGAAEPSAAPALSEAEKGEIAKLVALMDSSHRMEFTKEAEALLNKGTAAVPALEELRQSTNSDDLRCQAELLLALIRGGEVVGGWQASLRTTRTTIHEGDAVPLAFTMTNRAKAEARYTVPHFAQDLTAHERPAAGQIYVLVRRIDPQPRKEMLAEAEVSMQFRAESALVIMPGDAKVTRLCLKPKLNEMLEEIMRAAAPDIPLSCDAYLPPGRYRVQALCRADEKGPLVASAAVEIAVRPWDWKAVDEAERAALHKHLAAAEAALEKDAVLRAKLRGAAAKLDDEDWQAREGASKALAEAGVTALPELFRLQASSASLEARTRATEVLDAVRAKVAEGGEPEAGLRAILRLDRRTVNFGETLGMTFEVRNVTESARPFLPVHELELTGAANALHNCFAHATIELIREDGAPMDRRIATDGGLPMERENASVDLAAGASRVRKIELTPTGDLEAEELKELAGDEKPFECKAVLMPGRYRVRIVYHSYTGGLAKGAADDLRSNWVAFEVRE